jgi:hypothetical protein
LDIKINVKRKFRINGKEYNSIEEMPGDIREIFEKARSSQAGSGHQINPAPMRTHIIFNGTVYGSIDEMPQDVRQLYEKVLKAAETGAAQPDIDITRISRGMPRGPKTPGTATPGDIRPTGKIQPSFSPRTLILSAMLVALILLLYYLFHGR